MTAGEGKRRSGRGRRKGRGRKGREVPQLFTRGCAPASRSTLQRYIDVIKAEAGISDEAIAWLKQKVNTPADCHGILLFDEIKLREC
jgi:hypothetical protein